MGTDLERCIRETMVCDTHDHQMTNEAFVGEKPDVIREIFQNYVSADFVSVCRSPKLVNEFLDLDEQTWTLHHWIRGACLTGITPANGMVYAPPHDCACYPEAKVYGFAAVAPSTMSLSTSFCRDVRPGPGRPPLRLRT